MTGATAPDRVVVDLVWRRMIAILEDQAQTLIRTAFSTATRESEDLSAGLFDRRGRMVAQAVTGTPGHVNAMALAVRHFLARHPLDRLAAGDVLISNDPWLCSGHLHDFTVVSPVFYRGRAVGAVANTIHVTDVGGLGFGPDGRDVHEEGLCVPICKFMRAGVTDEVIVDMIRANVREPEQVIGDLLSSVAGNAFAADRLIALLTEFDLEAIEAVADAVIARTREAVASRIRALPSGAYHGSLILDGYDAEVSLRLTMTISNDRMTLDFAGSSRATPRGINVVLNYTTAYAVFGVNCLLNPDIPCNHGSLAPIEVVAPEGSVLNAMRPAAVSARHMIGHMLPDLVFGALSGVVPTPAEGAGLIWNPSLRGEDSHGRRFTTVTFNAGGAGAHVDRDGWNATAFPSGVKTMPVEVVEAAAPVLFVRKELRPDSGGPGRFRGGLGQTIEIVSDGPMRVAAMFDRIGHPARGRDGGASGASGTARLASGLPFAPKGSQDIAAGDSMILELPGGGGYGPVDRRDRDAVLNDVRDGYVTSSQALAAYGVAADD